MKIATIFSSALMLALAGTAGAQVSKTLTGETKTVTVSVEAIERASREVTVKKPDGTYDVFYVPDEVKRFDTLKIGDKIVTKYYENVFVRLQAPGEKPANSESNSVNRTADRNAASASHQRTITATITKIDQKAPSITFSGPNGWAYSTRVEDTKALAKVKVGDKVDITWTEAAVVSIETAK
jgi:Cu/Ag efflux protein CusF